MWINSNKRWMIVVGLLGFLMVGLSVGPALAESTSNGNTENFRELLEDTDGIIRSLRLRGKVSDNSLIVLEDKYTAVFPNQGDSVLDKIQSLKGSQLTSDDISEIKEIRSDIKSVGKEAGLEVGFLYEHAVYVILGVSFLLAIVVNLISRTVVDWEEVNRVQEKQSELQDELKKARKENDTKKMHKVQQRQQKFMQEHAGTMFSPMKSMLIIFIPFIIVFNLLSSTYSGWVVAWLPFNLPWPDIGFPLLSRFFKGTISSLGYFGWYILVYFGFSQFWRKLLIPGR